MIPNQYLKRGLFKWALHEEKQFSWAFLPPSSFCDMYFGDDTSFPKYLALAFFVAASMLVQCRSFFIGPKSDHCLPLSVTHSLTPSCLVNLWWLHVTLACEDANSQLVEVVTVADAGKRVDDSLVQIWKLKFVQTLSKRFEVEFWSRSWS